jgi:replicative DNA helicase
MNKNFDYLGNTFQIQLLNQIIVDKDFSQSIMDVIESSYFDNKYFKIILQLIKEYYKKYRATPNFDTLDQIIKSEISQELVLKIVLDTIVQVKNAPNEGASFVQEKALKFCKQQELQKAMDKAQKIISEGDFESYDKVEGLVRNALQVGEIDKGTTDIFQGLDTVLEEDYRHPIPMGIAGIDKLLKGGLAKGEIGVILAPTGVGKSSILTKIANTAFNMGYNVLQIFFEDNPKIIQRKHFTIWTGIAPDDLANHKEEVITKITEIKETMSNKLVLKKMASDTVSMSYIKNQVRKMIADGNNFDMILLDYIDCVLPDVAQDEWKAEGSVMRAFEAMCHELNLVGWTATQGNRCVSLDTIVDIENKGKIEIKDVTVGDKILTHDGYKNVYHVFPVEKQPVYRIKTKSGKEIKVSSKHKFPTSEKTLKSIESGLKVGDNLFIKNIFEIDEIESIELIGEEDTVDISVEDTHMFFANDIYTHNSSISAEVVTTDQMGGSIKKAQVGHVIITVAKTLQQKEMNLATIAITKSRLGKDGVVFENCKFNNEMLEIDTDSSVTFLGFEEQQEERKRDRVKELMEKRKQKQEQQNLI